MTIVYLKEICNRNSIYLRKIKIRNYIDILEEIDAKLKNTEYENFRLEIEIPFRNYCSALEICYEVKLKIKNFELNNDKIRELIGTQIDEFYAYCQFDKM